MAKNLFNVWPFVFSFELCEIVLPILKIVLLFKMTSRQNNLMGSYFFVPFTFKLPSLQGITTSGYNNLLLTIFSFYFLK